MNKLNSLKIFSTRSRMEESDLKQQTKNKGFFSIFILSLIFFLIGTIHSAGQVRPTSLFVDGAYAGNTTSDGSSSSPFKSIRAALDYRENVLGIAGMSSNEEIIVKAGTYAPNEAEMIFFTAANGGKDSYWITLRAEGDVYIDGANLFSKKYAALITITSGAQNIKIKGFKLKNQRNNSALRDPATGSKDNKFGIQLANTVKNIEISNNEIYDFSWTTDVDPMKSRLQFTTAEIIILKAAQGSDNIGAINVVGSSLVPITNLLIRNNKIHNIISGWTEGIQINGNIDGFEVSNNTITEVQNIGIVAAGHYNWVTEIPNATVTADLNYARNGVIKNNKVTSCRSPIAAAAGIYCDGSRNIRVENNVSSDGQVGFSIGNENSNVNSGGHILRNNISYDNTWAGIVIGVPGAATNSFIDTVVMTGNNVYRNGGVLDTYLGNMGASELIIQKNIKNLTVRNNIIYAANHNNLVTFAMPFDAGMTSFLNTIKFNYNLYNTNATATPPASIFDLSQLGAGYDYYGTFDWYQMNRTEQDRNSIFANPQFEDIGSLPINLNLKSNSPAINIGDPMYVIQSGETDYSGKDRIVEGRVDIGAYEFGATSVSNQPAAIDGIKSTAENYVALVTGVTGSAFSNIYGYSDEDYIYIYAEIAATNLSEYNVYLNINGATGFSYMWDDASDYYIDANYNVLNKFDTTATGSSFVKTTNTTDIEFIRTSLAIEGRIVKSIIGVANTGTVGIGLEGHTANWDNSLGTVPTSGSMVYLTLPQRFDELLKTTTTESPIQSVNTKNVTVYPNPVAENIVNFNYFTPQVDNVHTEIIGVNSQIYLTKNSVSKDGSNFESIDVKNLKAGIYFLRLHTTEKMYVKKIFIE